MKTLSHPFFPVQEETSPALSPLKIPLPHYLSVPSCEVARSGPVGPVSKCLRYLPFFGASLSYYTV